MTTISNTTASQLAAAPPAASEKGRLASSAGGGVAEGAIGSSETRAPTRTVDAIDGSLAADASGGPGASGPRLDPSKARERIDGLIAGQVGNGSLTGDQATELKGLFAGSGNTGPEGPGAAPGAGGRPPGPPPSGAAATGGASGAGGGTASSAQDLLASFIQQLQTTPNSGYAVSGAGGASGTGVRASAALFDFKT